MIYIMVISPENLKPIDTPLALQNNVRSSLYIYLHTKGTIDILPDNSTISSDSLSIYSPLIKSCLAKIVQFFDKKLIRIAEEVNVLLKN